MIIDVHGHFTRAPSKLGAYRAAQIRQQNRPVKGDPRITDEEIAESLQENIKQMDARGIDTVLFSPQASAMGHQFGNEEVSRYWTEVNNDLIYRACRLYPDRLIPVCQLPQSPGVSPANCTSELERCVEEMGFVGCNINPDVSGGVSLFTPSLGDEWWYPLWEKMVELNVPGMIHASATLNPALHLNGSHYINQDTSAAFELCYSRVFDDFPNLKLVIPHGGGALPFHYNRCRALHTLHHKRPFEEVVKHLYFDLAVYDIGSIELLIRILGAEKLLYASEMFGTGKGLDPSRGRTFDDMIDQIEGLESVSVSDKRKIFETNAKALYTRANW